jgi:hypothetical protein
MLGELGFRGFPSLAFLDAEGKLLARQRDRTVAGFQTTLESVTSLVEKRARFENGEKGLEFEIFVAEYELDVLEYDSARARAEGMKKLSDDQRAQVKQIVQDLEVVKLASGLQGQRDQAAAESAADAAGQRFHEMFDAGYRPGKRAESQFWGILANWADKNGKVEDLEQALAWMQKTYAENPRMADQIKALQDRVEQLKKESRAKP